MVRRPQEMSPDPEEIQHESVDREKPPRVRRGFDPAHLSRALSRRLMRNLCAVVLVSVRALGDGRHDRPSRCPMSSSRPCRRVSRRASTEPTVRHHTRVAT